MSSPVHAASGYMIYDRGKRGWARAAASLKRSTLRYLRSMQSRWAIGKSVSLPASRRKQPLMRRRTASILLQLYSIGTIFPAAQIAF